MPFGENPLHSLMRRERETGRTTEVQAQLVSPEAVARAKRLVSVSEQPLEDFEDLYGRQTIERDKAFVQMRETQIAQKYSQLPPHIREKYETIDRASMVFEAMTYEGVKEHRWLGPHARPLKTSRFDDFNYGVDLAVEIERGSDPSQQLALTMDLTFGEQAQQRKFEHIREHLLKGQLGKIKYYRSDRSGFRGELSMIPNVVIGIEPQNVARMSRVWLQDSSRLKILPAQMIMIDEIAKQLEAFSMFAKRKGVDVAARAYDRARNVLEPIRLQKQQEMRYQTLDDDRVYRAILESTRQFNS